MSNINSSNNEHTAKQSKEILQTLKTRFENNMERHKNLQWEKIEAKLKSDSEKLKVLNDMEITGGEPDVIGQDSKTGEFIFVGLDQCVLDQTVNVSKVMVLHILNEGVSRAWFGFKLHDAHISQHIACSF